MKVLKPILIILFVLIILCLFFMSCFFHNKIHYVKVDKENNEIIGHDVFVSNNDQYFMMLGFPNIPQTFYKGITTISLETRNQKTNLIECDLYAYSYDRDVNFKIKNMVLLITDLKTNQVIDSKEIYLNDENLTANNKYIADHQINFENINHNNCDGFYHILYYYDDFTNNINKIKLNFSLVWDYDNKSYSYSNEYLLKKKWEGLGFNICLD